MITDVLKAGNRRLMVADTHVQVAENIQRREVVRFTFDDFAVFLDRRRDLTHFQVSLGCAQSLYLIERHVLRIAE